jgi:hypothetical protein
MPINKGEIQKKKNSWNGCVEKKERVADGEEVVLKMTMNNIMLIKSYGAVLCCQVPNGGVFFNGIYEGKETAPLIL